MPIKVCPHCGGKSYLNTNYSYSLKAYFVFVKCEMCSAQGKSFRSQEHPERSDWENEACCSAVNAWNMRYKTNDEEND